LIAEVRHASSTEARRVTRYACRVVNINRLLQHGKKNTWPRSIVVAQTAWKMNN
jgi:hypothetical protein